MQSKFSQVFGDVMDLDDNKKKELAGKLDGLEDVLDNAANKVRDVLSKSHTNFDMEIDSGQRDEIIRRSLGNLSSGL